MLAKSYPHGDCRADDADAFCIIEGRDTVMDFAQMDLQEIRDNITRRRNKIFLLMEEVRLFPFSRFWSLALPALPSHRIQNVDLAVSLSLIDVSINIGQSYCCCKILITQWDDVCLRSNKFLTSVSNHSLFHMSRHADIVTRCSLERHEPRVEIVFVNLS